MRALDDPENPYRARYELWDVWIYMHEITVLEGACRLTLTHELEGAPHLALLVGGAYEDGQGGGGFPWVLSDLKSLLETGAGLAG